MRITVVGVGYVGLVSGACFSEFGHEVFCIDKDEGKIASLKEGHIPIFEPGLEQIVERNTKAGRLTFSTDVQAFIPRSDAVFIAVGTPSRRGDGHADLKYVYAAAEEIAQHINGYTVVVNKSTVPVGTGQEVHDILSQHLDEALFDVVSNPEFLREGSAVEDFMRPDRIVVGAEDEKAISVLRSLYRPLSLRDVPLVITKRVTAELIKYAANAFLATKVSFINEIADLCEATGANVQEVASGMGSDGRIGAKFLHPGPGYGGSCFPKDTLALLRTAERFESPLRIVQATVDVNKQRKRNMAQRIISGCGGDVSGKTIAVLGLSFKPNTDDMRESPSLDIIPRLVELGAHVQAYDPESMKEAKLLLPEIRFCDDAYEAVSGADVLVILTEWNQFRALDLERVRSLLRSPVVFDLRNIYKPEEMIALGFNYSSLGRPTC